MKTTYQGLFIPISDKLQMPRTSGPLATMLDDYDEVSHPDSDAMEDGELAGETDVDGDGSE